MAAGTSSGKAPVLDKRRCDMNLALGNSGPCICYDLRILFLDRRSVVCIEFST